MVISYIGKQFIKVQSGDFVTAFNPPSKDSALYGKASRFGSDLVLITTNHPDYNGAETVAYGDKKPFVVSGPGEYEVKGNFIKGVMSKTEIEGVSYVNSSYVIDADEITICFLGPVKYSEINSEFLDALGEIDILFIPLDKKRISSDEAVKLVLSIEPKMIIPLEYGAKNSSELVKFVKEGLGKDIVLSEKLVVKKKDLVGKTNDVAVLEGGF